ncbi:3740_t:CDS:2 [Acaulospora morrowiae]|uniref:3740_t:CDS:1 n=1 Tax=Acaulospora morrowiae TaxID=94023 RepID=A0A9N9ATD2_9GLOM|nr:3740_t:CDS:2 [Acaulospora morrowiae]
MAPQIVTIWINDDMRPGAIQKCDILLYTRMNQLIHISEFSGNVPLPKTININKYPNSGDSDDLIYENSNTSTT